MNKTIEGCFTSIEDMMPESIKSALIDERPQTVLRHYPLQGSDGHTAEEVWMVTQVFAAHPEMDEPFAVPRGGAVKVWERGSPGTLFQLVAAAQVETWMARVRDGRYIISNGNTDLNTHPKIKQWDNKTAPAAGKNGLLSFPGNYRVVRLHGSCPMVATVEEPPLHALLGEHDLRTSLRTPTGTFHKQFRECQLVEIPPAPPVAIAAVMREEEAATLPVHIDELPGSGDFTDIFDEKKIRLVGLDLPVILSNDMDTFLGDDYDGHPEDLYDTLEEAVMQYLDDRGVMSVYLVHLPYENAEVDDSEHHEIVTRYSLDDEETLQPGHSIRALDGDPQQQLHPFVRKFKPS